MRKTITVFFIGLINPKIWIMRVDNLNYIWIFLAFLSLFVIAFVLWRFKKRQQDLIAVPKYLRTIPHQSSFKAIQYVEAVPFSRRSRRLQDQHEGWQTLMRQHGHRLEEHHVSALFYVHGTFVGLDPFSIARGVQAMFPGVSERLIRGIQHFNRKQSNLLLRDQANYLPEYISLTQAGLGNTIACREFRWSSGNHHAARLIAAIELIENIGRFVKSGEDKDAQRMLLIGHSHAGQVFALFTHILENTVLGQDLLKIATELTSQSVDLAIYLDYCRKISFDFATFGSPVLYPWPERSSRRLINVTNHRGHPYLAGRRRGIPFTLDGDYIQQWGTLGSDFPATTPKERRINKALDKILGEGLNRSKWSRIRKHRTRVSPYGFTYLVDYADHSGVFPNFFSTVFGHGIYTRFDVLEFNMSLICEHLY